MEHGADCKLSLIAGQAPAKAGQAVGASGGFLTIIKLT
jgi:hypothetical protein